MLRMMAAAVVMAMAANASAAVIVPVKDYVKPEEKILVNFEKEKGEQGKKLLAAFGARGAEKMPELFDKADAGDVIVGNGGAAFSLYTMDGKKLDFTAAKAEADGSIDIAAFYPQVKQSGTYVLVWKDAQPLVIETLNNPGRTKADYERAKDEIEHLDATDRAAAMKTFEPTVTHIVPLQYGVIKTDKGDIKIKFAYDFAPHTVDNFIRLSNEGFYDGSTFHRVIPGFMIQGGDSTSNVDGRAGTGGPGYSIMPEFSEKLHERGTLSMARSQDPASAGSQFFIMHAKSTNLDGSYAAFGDVIDGMDVVEAIVRVPTSDDNGTVSGVKPKIESVRILPATGEQYDLGKTK